MQTDAYQETSQNLADAISVGVQNATIALSQAVNTVKAKASEKADSKDESEGEKPENLSPEGAGRKGALNEAKRRNRIPTSQSPEEQLPNVDKRGKEQPGRRYRYKDTEGNPVEIRDDAGGHTYPDDPSQNRGPHFNDPEGNHYDY